VYVVVVAVKIILALQIRRADAVDVAGTHRCDFGGKNFTCGIRCYVETAQNLTAVPLPVKCMLTVTLAPWLESVLRHEATVVQWIVLLALLASIVNDCIDCSVCISLMPGFMNSG